MNEMIVKTILAATNAQKISHTQVIQELWSGYGEILRVGLIAGDCESIILKHINPPTKGEGKHPRGWDTDFSHERKIKSYKVEIAWYQNWNAQNNIDQDSPTPKCIGSHNQDGEVFMILEDLNSSGYPVRLDTAKWPQIESCLKWLANFHANFLNVKTEDLWETGTYWHLDTRPDELAAIADIEMQ